MWSNDFPRAFFKILIWSNDFPLAFFKILIWSNDFPPSKFMAIYANVYTWIYTYSSPSALTPFFLTTPQTQQQLVLSTIIYYFLGYDAANTTKND